MLAIKPLAAVARRGFPLCLARFYQRRRQIATDVEVTALSRRRLGRRKVEIWLEADPAMAREVSALVQRFSWS